MPAPASLQGVLNSQRKTHSSSGAAASTVAAGNATFDNRELHELINAANAIGYDVTLAAGAVVLVPKS